MIEIQVADKIRLKQIQRSDASDIFAIVDKEREYLREWLPFVDHTLRIEDTLQFIDSVYDADPENPELVFIILNGQQTIGLIGYKDTDHYNKKTEIGYWLSQSQQKQGIMTQCVDKLIDYAFDHLGINRIQIKCAVGNEASKRVPNRLHFTFEGIERDGEILVDEKYTDLEIYSLIKRDLISRS